MNATVFQGGGPVELGGTSGSLSGKDRSGQARIGQVRSGEARSDLI